MAIVEGSAYLRVTNPEQSAKWFKEKLGGHSIRKDRADMQEIYGLVLSWADDPTVGSISFGTLEPDSDSPPVLYAGHIEHARKILSERGVQAGAIQTDQQG